MGKRRRSTQSQQQLHITALDAKLQQQPPEQFQWWTFVRTAPADVQQPILRKSQLCAAALLLASELLIAADVFSA